MFSMRSRNIALTGSTRNTENPLAFIRGPDSGLNEPELQEFINTMTSGGPALRLADATQDYFDSGEQADIEYLGWKWAVPLERLRDGINDKRLFRKVQEDNFHRFTPLQEKTLESIIVRLNHRNNPPCHAVLRQIARRLLHKDGNKGALGDSWIHSCEFMREKRVVALRFGGVKRYLVPGLTNLSRVENRRTTRRIKGKKAMRKAHQTMCEQYTTLENADFSDLSNRVQARRARGEYVDFESYVAEDDPEVDVISRDTPPSASSPPASTPDDLSPSPPSPVIIIIDDDEFSDSSSSSSSSSDSDVEIVSPPRRFRRSMAVRSQNQPQSRNANSRAARTQTGIDDAVAAADTQDCFVIGSGPRAQIDVDGFLFVQSPIAVSDSPTFTERMSPWGAASAVSWGDFGLTESPTQTGRQSEHSPQLSLASFTAAPTPASGSLSPAPAPVQSPPPVSIQAPAYTPATPGQSPQPVPHCSIPVRLAPSSASVPAFDHSQPSYLSPGDIFSPRDFLSGPGFSPFGPTFPNPVDSPPQFSDFWQPRQPGAPLRWNLTPGAGANDETPEVAPVADDWEHLRNPAASVSSEDWSNPDTCESSGTPNNCQYASSPDGSASSPVFLPSSNGISLRMPSCDDDAMPTGSFPQELLPLTSVVPENRRGAAPAVLDGHQMPAALSGPTAIESMARTIGATVFAGNGTIQTTAQINASGSAGPAIIEPTAQCNLGSNIDMVIDLEYSLLPLDLNELNFSSPPAAAAAQIYHNAPSPAPTGPLPAIPARTNNSVILFQPDSPVIPAHLGSASPLPRLTLDDNESYYSTPTTPAPQHSEFFAAVQAIDAEYSQDAAAVVADVPPSHTTILRNTQLLSEQVDLAARDDYNDGESSSDSLSSMEPLLRNGPRRESDASTVDPRLLAADASWEPLWNEVDRRVMSQQPHHPRSEVRDRVDEGMEWQTTIAAAAGPSGVNTAPWDLQPAQRYVQPAEQQFLWPEQQHWQPGQQQHLQPEQHQFLQTHLQQLLQQDEGEDGDDEGDDDSDDGVLGQANGHAHTEEGPAANFSYWQALDPEPNSDEDTEKEQGQGDNVFYLQGFHSNHQGGLDSHNPSKTTWTNLTVNDRHNDSQRDEESSGSEPPLIPINITDPQPANPLSPGLSNVMANLNFSGPIYLPGHINMMIDPTGAFDTIHTTPEGTFEQDQEERDTFYERSA